MTNTERSSMERTDNPFSWLPAGLLAMVVDVVSDGILVLDPDGTILQTNEAFAQLCGYERWELEGAPVAVLAHRESLELDGGRSMPMADVADAPGRWTGRTLLRRRDGEVIECESWVDVVDVDGAALRVTAHHVVSRRRCYGSFTVDEIDARAHELVSSLASLRGYVELLDRLPLDDQATVRDRLRALMATTTDRLEGLVESVRSA